MGYNNRAYMRNVINSFNEASMSTQHPDNYAYGQLRGRDTIRNYVLGGNATFTIVSKSTGRRFTYRVKSAPKDRNQNWSTNNQNRDLFFVSVLIGGDNESSYSYMGELRRNPNSVSGHRYFYSHGRKAKIAPDAKSVQGFIWFILQMESDKPFEHQMEFWHEGKCGRCGRKLTVPESIEAGIGPECAGKE